MRIDEVHKFSDETFDKTQEKLDIMVNDFKLFKFNKGMENRNGLKTEKREVKTLSRNYKANNACNTQDTKKEHHDPSICNIRRFEMIKYSFDADDEYVAIKEREHSDHSRINVDACQSYRELFRIMDEGWLVTKAEHRS
ncbi:hypothetical protein Tco_0849889 [Tanacetum coccineum]